MDEFQALAHAYYTQTTSHDFFFTAKSDPGVPHSQMDLVQGTSELHLKVP
jgi:hypothetical protein